MKRNPIDAHLRRAKCNRHGEGLPREELLELRASATERRRLHVVPDLRLLRVLVARDDVGLHQLQTASLIELERAYPDVTSMSAMTPFEGPKKE